MARKKTAAQLQREIDAVLATGKRRSSRAGVADKWRKPRLHHAAKSQAAAAYFSSLPPARPTSVLDAPSFYDLVDQLRKETNEAISSGALPSGTKIAVRKISHGKSLKIEITAWPGAVFSTAYTEHLMDPDGTPIPKGAAHNELVRLSPDLSEALNLLWKIADRHNYENRAGDRAYYFKVDAQPVEDAAAHGIRLESKREFSELLEQAQAAAKIIGPQATKALCDGKPLNRAGESCFRKVIRAAETYRTTLFYNPGLREWLPKTKLR